MTMKTKLAQAAPEQEKASSRVDITKMDELKKVTVFYDHLHTLTVRARTAMSHFASADAGPLALWHQKLFLGPGSP